MSHLFRTQSGEPLPRNENLAHAAMGSELTALGDPIATPELLARLVRHARPNQHHDFQALNNRILRAVVDCLTRGDEISQSAVSDLAELSQFTHARHTPERSFVFANLKVSRSRGLHELQRVLEWAENDPQSTASHATKALRFSLFSPEQLGEEHVLIEDALARAAVFSFLLGEHCHRAATTFAKLAVAFRTAPGDVLPRKTPNAEQQDRYASFAQEVQEGTAGLACDARCIAEHRAASQDVQTLGRVLQCSLQCLYDSSTHRSPWSPLGFFLRSDMLADLAAAPRFKLAGASAAIQEMQQELHHIWEFLDSLSVSCISDLHQVVLLLNQDEVVLPSTRKALAELKEDVGI